MGFLNGKRALILGLASDRSIAFGIAEAMHREGATLALTYPNEKFKNRVEDMAKNWNTVATLPCDVGSDEQIAQLFKDLEKHWDGLDIIIHSVAYAPADQLEGDYLTALSREGFKIAHDISSYSLGALAKAGLKMMEGRNGSILTLTYLGSERAMVSYNVMGLAKASLEANVRYLAQSLGPKGIRVNAISAGPIKTLAAAGIKDFRKMLAFNENISPLRKKVSIEEVGNVAAFLTSDLASGVTGEIVHVDAGFHAIVPMME
ncbi:MAG TPA: enoyl-ACP reductase [Gammaproteobacteria bacterium]|jgi:enoyl-[acyl-carrier protein] reductase I|nr:enoyl-ACP reductase [Gammaproteobacteria bacterium]